MSGCLKQHGFICMSPIYLGKLEPCCHCGRFVFGCKLAVVKVVKPTRSTVMKIM